MDGTAFVAMTNVGIAASCVPMVTTNRPRTIATLITVNTTNAAGNEGGVGVVVAQRNIQLQLATLGVGAALLTGRWKDGVN
jgi:hypothetical protein